MKLLTTIAVLVGYMVVKCVGQDGEPCGPFNRCGPGYCCVATLFGLGGIVKKGKCMPLAQAGNRCSKAGLNSFFFLDSCPCQEPLNCITGHIILFVPKLIGKCSNSTESKPPTNGCQSASECGSNQCCVANDDSDEGQTSGGVCTPFGNEGEPCSTGYPDGSLPQKACSCQGPLTCITEDNSNFGKCGNKIETTTTTSGCQSASECDSNQCCVVNDEMDKTSGGVCTPFGNEGENCSTGSPNGSPSQKACSCQEPLTCITEDNSNFGKCGNKIETTTTTSGCQSASECDSNQCCVANDEMDKTSGGVCTPFGNEGENCSTSSPNGSLSQKACSCQEPLTCITEDNNMFGKCGNKTETNPSTKMCLSNRECGKQCCVIPDLDAAETSGGVCKPPAEKGENCTRSPLKGFYLRSCHCAKDLRCQSSEFDGKCTN